MSPKPYRIARGLNQVWPGLWVGSAIYTTAEVLETLGIGTLIWATLEISLPVLPANVHVIQVPVRDDPSVDISSFFPTVAATFRESQGCGMAIVCRAGVSRSASLALAALIAQSDLDQMTLRFAYETLKTARPFIRPNTGFFSQLIEFEKSVRGKATVTMVTSPYNASEKIPDVYLEELRQMTSSTFNAFIPL